MSLIWAWAEFRRLLEHPWWLDIPMPGPPMGPNNMAWLDAGLATMAAVPIPEPLKLHMVLNVSLYVIGRSRFYRDTTQTTDAPDFVAVLGRVLDPERYPALTRALARQAFDDDEIDWAEADFGFCLDRLLDGYATFVDGVGSAPGD